MKTATAANQIENIIFNTAKRITQERSNQEDHADELFLIEKFHLLDTLDKMMKVIRLCDWVFGYNVIKAILLHINWSKLSIRRSVQLVKRSQASPEVLKDFIIFLNKTHDNEIIECIDYAAKINLFCYPNSNNVSFFYENIFCELAKKNLLSHKLTMYLFNAFKGWGPDFLKYSINIIQWQTLSNKECVSIFNRYSILKNNSCPELSSLYDKILRKLAIKRLIGHKLNHLCF